MALPFLKKKIAPPVIIAKTLTDDVEGKSADPLEIAAEDLMNAMDAKDPKMIAKAFRAAFELLEMRPHEEVEHDEPAEE